MLLARIAAKTHRVRRGTASLVPVGVREFFIETSRALGDTGMIARDFRAGSANLDRGIGGGAVLPQPKMAGKRRFDEPTSTQEPYSGVQVPVYQMLLGHRGK